MQVVIRHPKKSLELKTQRTPKETLGCHITRAGVDLLMTSRSAKFEKFPLYVALTAVHLMNIGKINKSLTNRSFSMQLKERERCRQYKVRHR